MRRSFIALLLCSLLAAGCASGTSTEPETAVAAGETESAASSSEEAAPSDDAPDSDADEPDDVVPEPSDDDEPAMAASSPIGAFFAEDGGFQTALDEYRLRVEEGILVCMAEQGFEFAVTGEGGTNAVEEAQNELSERAWTSEFGYGISTSFDSVAQAQATNPNAEILFSMGPAEREAWTETLIGVGNDLGDLGNGAIPLEERGCIGSSIIETGGQGPIDGLEDFGEAYAEREEAIFDTNDMIVAVGDWTQCMSEVGYPDYSELDAPESSIRDRLSVITAPIRPALDALEPGEGQALFDGDEVDLAKLPGLDLDALRSLQAEELTTALADLDCYDAHVRDVYEPLRDEFEIDLMNEFGEELDALRSIGQ